MQPVQQVLHQAEKCQEAYECTVCACLYLHYCPLFNMVMTNNFKPKKHLLLGHFELKKG